LKDKEKHFKICKNAEYKSYSADEIIYSNILNTNENCILLKGSVNVYKREIVEENQIVNVGYSNLEFCKNTHRRSGIWTVAI
jgi:hypothetical protein